MKLLLTAFLLCVTLPLYATTYYISPSGDDGNDGLSRSTPFGSFRHATEAMTDGDTLTIMEGVYINPLNRASGQVNLYFGNKTNGTFLNNATFQGDGSAKTTFQYVDGIGTNVTMQYNIRVTGTGNTVSGFKMEGDILGDDWWQPVISVHQCSNAVISDIWLEFPTNVNGRTGISPLWVPGVDNVLVQNCLVDGGGIGGRVFNYDKFHKMTYRKCTFVNQRAQSGDRGMGMLIEGNSGTKVENCIFYNNENYGITFWPPEGSLPVATQTVENCLYWQPGLGFLDNRDTGRIVVEESGTLNQDPNFQNDPSGKPYSVPLALADYGWNYVPEPTGMIAIAALGMLMLRRKK